MEGRFSCFLVLTLQFVSWVSATSRHFAPNDGTQGVPVHQPVTGQASQSLKVSLGSNFSLKEASKSMELIGGKLDEEAYVKGMKKIGSSPPSCEHKCYGCIPCEAIQVPTISSHTHVDLQYTNYEPEGWKCKCGPSFYSP